MSMNQIIVGVITEKNQTDLYYNLFRVLLGNQIQVMKKNEIEKVIKTDTAIIKFVPKLQSSRGYKFHFVLNLTQDKEFDENVVKGMLAPLQGYLKRDESWEEFLRVIK